MVTPEEILSYFAERPLSQMDIESDNLSETQVMAPRILMRRNRDFIYYAEEQRFFKENYMGTNPMWCSQSDDAR